jgi:hypothetical protein
MAITIKAKEMESVTAPPMDVDTCAMVWAKLFEGRNNPANFIGGPPSKIEEMEAILYANCLERLCLESSIIRIVQEGNGGDVE